MKILNKSVSERFESFYKDIAARIGAHKFCPNPPGGILGDCHLEDGVIVVRLRTDVNKSRFEQNVAHELLHALQIVEGWPTIKSRLPDNSAVAQLGATLASLVLDLNVEDRLKQLPFDSKPVIGDQYRNLTKAILGEIPSSGSYQWRRAVMMYIYASLIQPPRKWKKLGELFLERAPHIARKGEELALLVKRHSWNTPDQALASMIAIRENIGLPSDQLSIVDRRTEQRF